MTENSPLGAVLNTAPPTFDRIAAERAALVNFGIEGDFAPLTSERDANWKIQTDSGAYVLKLANPAEPWEVTDFQIQALLHLEQSGLPVPRVERTIGGKTEVVTSFGVLRLLSFLEGEMMHRARPSSALRRSVGEINARLTMALSGFTHPAADHVLQWDIQHAAHLAPLLRDVPADLQKLARSAHARFVEEALPVLPHLPRQVCHADLNPHNVVVSRDGTTVTGILDFGDMVSTPRVCDLAVTAAYQVDPAEPETSLTEFVASYTSVLPLTEEEIRLVPLLTEARWLTTLCIAAHRAKRQPQNAAYILRNVPLTRAGLRAFAGLDREALATQLIESTNR